MSLIYIVGQRITPTEINVITKEGEINVRLTLDVNINLNTNGIQISAVVQEQNAEEEKTKWVIPEFGKLGRVKFGKSETESQEAI